MDNAVLLRDLLFTDHRNPRIDHVQATIPIEQNKTVLILDQNMIAILRVGWRIDPVVRHRLNIAPQAEAFIVIKSPTVFGVIKTAIARACRGREIRVKALIDLPLRVFGNIWDMKTVNPVAKAEVRACWRSAFEAHSALNLFKNSRALGTQLVFMIYPAQGLSIPEPRANAVTVLQRAPPVFIVEIPAHGFL